MKISFRVNLEHYRNQVLDDNDKPISIRALSELIGHNFEALRQFEQGKTSRFSSDLLIKLLIFFHTEEITNDRGEPLTIGDLIITEYEE